MVAPEERMHFIGLLSNVDSSILKVNLKHNFKIEAFSEREGLEFFSSLEGIPTDGSRAGLLAKDLMIQRCFSLDEEKIFLVRNSVPFAKHIASAFLRTLGEFQHGFLIDYLDPIIRLMRLFKEGDIRMPLSYFYIILDGKVERRAKSSSNRTVSNEQYHLMDSEANELNSFIHNVQIPFSEPSVELAFENLELSYETHNMNVSFLTLMVGLEALLNRGQQELRYSISRNTAVLLGKDKEESAKIFSEIKNLYDKRSEVAHQGKSKTLRKEDLLKLRHYLRESIKEIYRIGKSKDEVLDLLNSHGFGGFWKVFG